MRAARGVAALPLLLLAGCAATITPPRDVASPATVWLLDYGRHSSLLLPQEPGVLAEYAFGDYRWFARGDNSSSAGVESLFFSRGATLGRRELRLAAGAEAGEIARATFAETVYPIEVEQARADALLEALERRWARGAGRAAPLYNPAVEMQFVPDAPRYSLWHNCNHETLRWLESAGARVRGDRTWSRFDVRPAR